MSNAPIHLFDKGTWQAPDADRDGWPRATILLDSGKASLLRQRGWKLVDQWGVYLTPDRQYLVSVNTDGTLRRARPYINAHNNNQIGA